MNSADFQDAIRNLAVEAGLRRIKLQNRKNELWVGVHQGVCIHLDLDAVRLAASFTSPESKDESASSEQDAAKPDDAQPGTAEKETKPITETFRRAAKIGIPAEWFEQNEIGEWGFQLVIDDARRKQLPRAQLTGLLHGVAEDLHDLGAEKTKPCCECPAPATTLAYIQSLGENPLFAPYCDACWENLKRTTGGQIKKAPPQQELAAWAALAGGVIVLTGLWGYAQHPEWGVPIPYLIIGCTAASAGLAAMTMAVANGSNLRLRIGVVLGVLFATLAGNIIGVKLLADFKNGNVSWPGAVPLYLFAYLPNHLAQESLYFAGGALGVILAFYLMRESERRRIR